MTPIHHMYVSAGVVVPPPAETWFNRDQARADARATAAVDLDPTDSITGFNRWSSKPSAIGLTDPIGGEKKVLVAARGELLLLKDNGAPGDPLIIDDGWLSVEPGCRWGQLVKTGSNTAVFFAYGAEGSGYPGLGENSSGSVSTAYYRYQKVSISGGNISLIGLLTPMGGIPLWDHRVPSQSIRYKSIVRHITGDIFVHMLDGFFNTFVLQVFDIGINNAGFPHTAIDIFGSGSGVLYAGDIAPAAELDSIHVTATNGNWQLTQLGVNTGALTFTASGFLQTGFASLNTKVGLALDQNGRLVNSHTSTSLLDFSIATGYTVVGGTGGAQNGAAQEGRAIDGASSGDPDPEIIFDLDASRGGYAQRNIHSMEINGVDEDFMQLATGKSAGTVSRISKALRVSGATITAGVQILENVGNTDYNTAPFKGVLVTDEYAKKDDDTIYGFYMKKVGGLLRPHGFIMRK